MCCYLYCVFKCVGHILGWACEGVKPIEGEPGLGVFINTTRALLLPHHILYPPLLHPISLSLLLHWSSFKA